MSGNSQGRVDYYEYIHSEEWKEKANAAKKRVGWRCQICNRPAGQVNLNAHHRTYKRLGSEWKNDITVLCEECHELYERHRRIPTWTPDISSPAHVTRDTIPGRVDRPIFQRPSLTTTQEKQPRKSTRRHRRLAGAAIPIVMLAMILGLCRPNITAAPKAKPTEEYRSLENTPIALAPVIPTVSVVTAVPHHNDLMDPSELGTASSSVVPSCVVTRQSNVRRGPSISDPVAGQLQAGDIVEIIGYSHECGVDEYPWFEIAPNLWVAAFLLECPAGLEPTQPENTCMELLPTVTPAVQRSASQ